MALVKLSDTELNQALKLIAKVPSFDGSPEELAPFLNRIEGILKLYPTQDERQTGILYLATDLRLSGEASRAIVMEEAKTWPEMKTALIEAFSDTSRFKGTLRVYVDELEYKAFKIRNNLGLDDDNITIKDVIDHKFPDRYLKSLRLIDISTISILRKASQMRECYERACLTEKYNDPNNNYDYNSKSYQNHFCDYHKKHYTDISEKSVESTRLIRRAHRYLK